MPENDARRPGRSPRALYGGDQETRIRQELVLGIGGLRALELLRLRPTVRHINEGHAAFAGLEKIRLLVSLGGLTYPEARERAAATNVFTTHTPVPAGIDRFPPELVEKYLAPYVSGAGARLSTSSCSSGRRSPANPGEPFSMAVLALRLSGHANAVSQLHARVSRRLWLGLLPELADEDIRIRAITNGVHRPTWTDPEVAKLSARRETRTSWTAPRSGACTSGSGRGSWTSRAGISRTCESEQGASPEEIEEARGCSTRAALTIGFAAASRPTSGRA